MARGGYRGRGSGRYPGGGNNNRNGQNGSGEGTWSKQKSQNSSWNSSKRKRDDDHSYGPAARRQRFDAPSMEYDFASIKRNMQLPTKKDFPKMPGEIFTNPKNILSNCLRQSARISTRFNTASHNHFQCYVSCDLPDSEKMELVGEGTNKKLAERAAFLHLLSRLYEDGIVAELWEKVERIDDATLKEEKDSKLDVYDYAARYGCIPRFTVSDGSKHSKLRKARKSYEVRIEMPEQEIDVTGKAFSKHMAEVAAGLKFKRAVEKYHLTKGTGALIVKDSSSLSVANARQFFEFYKDVDKTTNVIVDVAGTKNVFAAQAMMNNKPLGEEVSVTGTKKKAEDLAYLVAAIHITKQDPDLVPRFLKALRAGNGNILRMVPPMDVTVEADMAYAMDDTIRAARKAGLRDDVDELETEDKKAQRDHRPRPTLSPDQAQMRSQRLLADYKAYLERSDIEQLRKTRAELPMSQYAPKVLDIVDNNVYSIIIGATGSGKTTQVPQILLDRAIQSGNGAECNIICTQPRRIAATSVARRVADERAERLQNTIGYHVRFDPKLPTPGGSVTYCTTGILLQQLQHNPDDVLDKISHLVIDEVHERDMLIDFLLIVLKKVMAARMEAGKKVPKVVLMSATIDSDLFASYFKNTSPDLDEETDCPTLSVPGRTFPVKDQYLENILENMDKLYGPEKLNVMYNDRDTVDYFQYERQFAKENPIAESAPNQAQEEDDNIIDWKKKAVVSANGDISTSTDNEDALVPVGLVAATIAHIANTTQEGAILVFLPGLDEMTKVNNILREQRPLGLDFKDESKYRSFLLHSSIPDSQKTVFEPVPAGCRKIILGTNIAETSITIPDVQYVVDTGKLREKRYDQIRRITKLQCTWASKSNSKQRAGRAGRVQNGHYYALFSRARHQSLRAIGLPELLRSDLQETCLDVKSQAFEAPVRQFLADAIEPPNPLAVDTAVENLITLDALTEDEELTALGRLLASLPVHPSLGKMIVLGMIFRCLDPMIVLGAASGERNMFVNPMESRRAAQDAKVAFARGSQSDHIALLNAFNEMRNARDTQGFGAMKDLAHRKFIHNGAFNGIESTAKQITDILVDAGLIPRMDRGRNEPRFGGATYNENSDKVEIIKALALAGMHPNLGHTSNQVLFRTPGEKNCMVHPSSVNAGIFAREGRGNYSSGGRKEAKLVTYTTMAKSNDGHNTFLRDTTVVHPLLAMLFGGRLYSGQSFGGRMVELDGWLQFWVHSKAPRTIGILLDFKRAMDRMQTEAFRDLNKKEPLADDKVREIFARNLPDILDIEQDNSWANGNGNGNGSYDKRYVDRRTQDAANFARGAWMSGKIRNNY
jgi:ATP-dependent RNA helicase DHX36